jgi:hypothetical protein
VHGVGPAIDPIALIDRADGGADALALRHGALTAARCAGLRVARLRVEAEAPTVGRTDHGCTARGVNPNAERWRRSEFAPFRSDHRGWSVARRERD